MERAVAHSDAITEMNCLMRHCPHNCIIVSGRVFINAKCCIISTVCWCAKMLARTYIHGCTADSVSFERSPSSFALDSLFYVQEIGRTACSDTYYTEHENIHSFLLMLTEFGTGELRTKDGRFPLRAGDLVFTDCMRWHSYGTADSHGWGMAWVHFNGCCARGYYEQFTRLGAPVVPSVDADLIRDLNSLIEINQRSSKSAELQSSDLIVSVLTRILVKADDLVYSRDRMPAFVEEALREINAHLSDNLTLDHFAHKLGVNKYHLQKEFTRHVGMSPNAYVCTARINVAKSLLVSKELTVSQVAEQAGFRNTGHFMNMFKRSTGLTPGEYRRRCTASRKASRS